MASLDDYYDTNDQINNYLIIKRENRLQLESFIYIIVNEDFNDVKILNKILEILNQNIKFVDSMIIFQENTYLKIDITKNYPYDSFEYNFIKDSIAYTINYHLNHHDINELLYLDLDKNPNNYDIQFNVLVTYSAKNQYFKYYMIDLFTSSNKVNFELIKGYYTKISSNLEYCNILRLKQIKTLKRKSIDLNLPITKDHNKEALERDDCKLSKKCKKETFSDIIKNFKKKSVISDDTKPLSKEEFKLIHKDKTYFFTNKEELRNTIRILENFKINFNIQILNNKEWLTLTSINIQILIMN
jgi:hypothetical protein